ncbi:MAG: cytochrome c oxidase assembly protein [Alphaproteobacteria bacterium]|nr:MAG: cytochrome c oxidase assembly protein [Alphaproteobacteria bacterium]
MQCDESKRQKKKFGFIVGSRLFCGADVLDYHSENWRITMHRNKNQKTVLYLLTILAVMTGLTFASPPLYRLFCQVTGFDGTARKAAKAPTEIGTRVITVRFNTDVDPNLSWSFAPSMRTMDVKLGEVANISFHVKNTGLEPVVGTSTYNVTPEKTAAYFNKLQCFCFTRHFLKPGEEADFPVQFFIDPAMAQDKQLDDVTSITLSYTFFKAPDQNLISSSGSTNYQ